LPHVKKNFESQAELDEGIKIVEFAIDMSLFRRIFLFCSIRTFLDVDTAH